MVTRIRKIVVTPKESDPAIATFDVTLYDPATNDVTHEQFADVAIEDFDTPTKWGDALVADYADIDLPTTP